MEQIDGTLFILAEKQKRFSVPRRLRWFREQGTHPSEAVHMFKFVTLAFPVDWFHCTFHALGESVCTVF